MSTTKAFVGVLATLVVLSAIFLLVERVAGRGRNRVQPIFHRGWLTDVVSLFTTVLLTKPFIRLMLVVPLSVLIIGGVTSADMLRSGGYSGFGPPSRQPTWLQAVEVYLLVDFCGYWIHRLFHRGAWWPFHAVHHGSTDLDGLGSLRVHPVNDLVVKLGQATPVLPLRDILYGTYSMPRGRYPENFGIHEPMPGGWVGQGLQPFVRLVAPRRKTAPRPHHVAG